MSAGCTKLSKGPYKRRHDLIGLSVYWELCWKYGIGWINNWFEEVPDTVWRSEEGQFEIWWDRPIETTVKLEHSRLDVILINQQDKEWTIVEFSVPWDKNVLLNEEEKIQRYIPLPRKPARYMGFPPKLSLFILGSLGTVTNQLKAELTVLGMERISGRLQTSVLIGTHNILRKVMNSDRKGKGK